MDPKAILDQSRQHASAWQYFNHQRLFELATQQGIRFESFDGYEVAFRLKMLPKMVFCFPGRRIRDGCTTAGMVSLSLFICPRCPERFIESRPSQTFQMTLSGESCLLS